MKHWKKNKIQVYNLRQNQLEFVKYNTLILKTHQRFKSESIMFLLKKLTILL